MYLNDELQDAERCFLYVNRKQKIAFKFAAKPLYYYI